MQSQIKFIYFFFLFWFFFSPSLPLTFSIVKFLRQTHALGYKHTCYSPRTFTGNALSVHCIALCSLPKNVLLVCTMYIHAFYLYLFMFTFTVALASSSSSLLLLSTQSCGTLLRFFFAFRFPFTFVYF